MANVEEEDIPFSDMSDEELQEAFAAGVLKPGLNVRVEEKVYKNNVVSWRNNCLNFDLYSATFYLPLFSETY